MGDSHLVPNALEFGAVIKANTTSDLAGASTRAAQLLLHIESLHQKGYGGARSTMLMYNACFTNYSKHTGAILCFLVQWCLLGQAYCQPNVVLFTAAIKAHVALIDAMLASIDDEADEEEEDKEENEEMEEKEKEVNEPMTTAIPMQKCAATNKNGKCLMIETSARRCKDLLLQLCLLLNQSRKDVRPLLKLTSIMLELVIKALMQANDKERVERVTRLRELGVW